MASNLTQVLTNGTGTYAMTAQEDNAVLETLVRAHKAGFADYGRAILYRTASDFDRGMFLTDQLAPPHENDYISFERASNNPDLVTPSLDNLFLIGSHIVHSVCEARSDKDCPKLETGLGERCPSTEQSSLWRCIWHAALSSHKSQIGVEVEVSLMAFRAVARSLRSASVPRSLRIASHDTQKLLLRTQAIHTTKMSSQPYDLRHARVQQMTPLEDASAKWLGLRRIQYLDPTGKERSWDCAVRKTRKGDVDGESHSLHSGRGAHDRSSSRG